MPNWCNNSIRINGDEKTISALVRVIENTKDGEDRVFQSLIGYPDHMTKADYDKDWYDTNIGWFGTKWDVSYSSCHFGLFLSIKWCALLLKQLCRVST